MAFFDKVDKVIYTDVIQNIGWQPYTFLSSGKWYFNLKGQTTPLRTADELIACYTENGIKVRPLSDLIDGIYIKELIEVSCTDYILNDKYCSTKNKVSSFSFNRLGTFLGIPKSRFTQMRTESNKTDREVLEFLLENYKKYSGIGIELKNNGIPREVYYARLRLGWDEEKAKTTPVAKIGRVFDHKGNEFESQKEMLKHYGVSSAQFFRRKKRGLSLEKCLSPTNPKLRRGKR